MSEQSTSRFALYPTREPGCTTVIILDIKERGGPSGFSVSFSNNLRIPIEKSEATLLETFLSLPQTALGPMLRIPTCLQAIECGQGDYNITATSSRQGADSALPFALELCLSYFRRSLFSIFAVRLKYGMSLRNDIIYVK